MSDAIKGQERGWSRSHETWDTAICSRVAKRKPGENTGLFCNKSQPPFPECGLNRGGDKRKEVGAEGR